MALLSCFYCCIASAEMRNLFTEFTTALEKGDLKAIDSLIKDGLQVNDAVAPTVYFAVGRSTSGIIQFRGGRYQMNASVSEDFLVSLIKRLAKSKADFTNAFALDDVSPLTYNLLKALLDAGANPDKYERPMTQPILFYKLERYNSTKSNIDSIKVLVDHKASLTKGIYGFRTHAMDYFLRHMGLEITSNLTENRLSYISEVLEILRKGGADKSDAKKYLDELRQKHRNIPDALKYLDKIEDAVNGSWWFW